MRDDGEPAGGELAGDALVRLGGPGVVGASEEHDGDACRVVPETFQQVLGEPAGLQGGLLLGLDRRPEGVRGGGRAPERGAQVQEVRAGRREAAREVQDRPQDAAPVLQVGEPGVVLEGGGQEIGLALGGGADDPAGRPLFPAGPPEVRQDQVVGAALQQVVKEAVGELRRVAEGRAAGGETARVGPLRHHRAKPQPAEEGGEEGPVGMHQEGAVEPEGRAPIGRRQRGPLRCVGRGCGRPLERAHQVQVGGRRAHRLVQIEPAVAGPAEGDGAPVHPHPGDAAPPVAPLGPAGAGEGAARLETAPGERLERKGRGRHEAPFEPPGDLQGDPEGPDQARLGRHQDAPAGECGHGGRHRPVVADPALHEEGRADRAVALDAVAVIHADRVDQAGQQVGLTDPLLGRVLHVAADEGGALVGEVGRGRPGQRQGRDVLEGHAERLAGRLFEEGAGPRAAGVVHGVIDRDAVLDLGVLGVLPADLEDGLDPGVEEPGPGGVGDDLVDDPAGSGVQPRDLPARARDPETDDGEPLRQRPQAFGEFRIAGAGGPDRVARGAPVDARQHAAVGLAQQHRLAGGGTDVEPQDTAVPGLGQTGFQGAELDRRQGRGQGRQPAEGRARGTHQPPGGRQRQGLVVQGPECRPVSLEPGGLRRDQEFVDPGPERLHQGAVLRRPADQHDPPVGQGGEEFQDLVRHHRAEPGGDAPAGYALVGRVGAVALAEDAAAPDHLVRGLAPGGLNAGLEVQTQAADLLDEELTGAGGALAAGMHGADASVGADAVDQQALAADAHHRIRCGSTAPQVGQGGLHRLGFGDGAEPQRVAQAPSGHRDARRRAGGQRREQVRDRLSGVAVVGPGLHQGQRPATAVCLVYRDR